MQTRRLRLGDVVDDYCPRERRLSNHVIVAMVEDTIKQTRCSTCDFEHPYKEAKIPPRRKKKDGTDALFQQVLDNVATERVTPPGVEPAAPAPVLAAPRGVLRPNGATARDAQEEAVEAKAPSAGHTVAKAPHRAAAAAAAASAAASASPSASATAPQSAPQSGGAPASPSVSPSAMAASPSQASFDDQTTDEDRQPAHGEEDAPLHRRALIRAQLPRTVGEAPVRQIPSFTVREAAAARPNKFRFKGRPGGRPQGAGMGSGMGMPGNQSRPGGGRGPQARGAGKKTGGHPQHRTGGHQAARPKGPHGNKRFK